MLAASMREKGRVYAGRADDERAVRFPRILGPWDGRLYTRLSTTSTVPPLNTFRIDCDYYYDYLTLIYTCSQWSCMLVTNIGLISHCLLRHPSCHHPSLHPRPPLRPPAKSCFQHPSSSNIRAFLHVLVREASSNMSSPWLCTRSRSVPTALGLLPFGPSSLQFPPLSSY